MWTDIPCFSRQLHFTSFISRYCFLIYSADPRSRLASQACLRGNCFDHHPLNTQNTLRFML